MAKGQKTVIQELEMMAVLAAMKVWKGLIKACRVVLFTDSERGCGKCRSHFPIFKKSAALCMLFVVELENAHEFVLAANVGP